MQFRELEFLSGAKDPSFVRPVPGLTDDESAAAAAAARRADAVGRVPARARPRAACRSATTRQVTASVRRAAHDRSSYADVWALAEALLQHDELAAAWRARHVVMVERMIGTKTGTGGSTGADYLRSRLDLRYYPLLWELRSVL